MQCCLMRPGHLAKSQGKVRLGHIGEGDGTSSGPINTFFPGNGVIGTGRVTVLDGVQRLCTGKFRKVSFQECFGFFGVS